MPADFQSGGVTLVGHGFQTVFAVRKIICVDRIRAERFRPRVAVAFEAGGGKIFTGFFHGEERMFAGREPFALCFFFGKRRDVGVGRDVETDEFVLLREQAGCEQREGKTD